jgi:hypothetical protein
MADHSRNQLLTTIRCMSRQSYLVVLIIFLSRELSEAAVVYQKLFPHHALDHDIGVFLTRTHACMHRFFHTPLLGNLSSPQRYALFEALSALFSPPVPSTPPHVDQRADRLSSPLRNPPAAVLPFVSPSKSQVEVVHDSDDAADIDAAFEIANSITRVTQSALPAPIAKNITPSKRPLNRA